MADANEIKGTFDNGATTGELRLLARAFNATKDEAARAAFLKGLNHILTAQYTNGGWPQYSPPPARGYPRHITFNDDTMRRLLEFLRDVATAETFAFVDSAKSEAARKAFNRGIDCIVKCQVKVNGQATVWCAQHDDVTLEPRPARSFELASLSGAESAGLLLLLMSLDNPTSETVRAVDSGAR
jgi:pectate lyase